MFKEFTTSRRNSVLPSHNSSIFVSLFLSAALLASCTDETVEPSVPAITATSGNTVTVENIAEMLHQHTAVLASDDFEGRAPATPGEEKTIAYLENEFKALGIGPGNGDSYFQAVAVTEITTSSNTVLSVTGNGYSGEFTYGNEMVVGTQQQVESIAIDNSDLVFVGYGIVAPERNWNDYADLDMAGKTAVILVNDPGFATQEADHFNGNAMTYYGRWTYKYEEAARQGAAGALIVHESAPAGYPWDVVEGSWTGPQISLQSENLNADRADIEGWLTLESAERLFDAAGLSYQELKVAASQEGFTAVPMSGLQASVAIENSIRNSSSQNVIAAIQGTQRPQETIIYTAHWDHLGVNVELDGDQIYNGAVDNATGTAALLALAKLHSAEDALPERTILFLAVTAEESGLLGSQWYAEHPIYPLATTVANINMDALNVNGPMKDVVIVGHRASELENYLEDAVATQNRYTAAEPNPERGYYYRSDHFNFAKVGVPALYAESGEDSVEHGRAWGAERASDYTNVRYHAPGDEYEESWDLSGAAQDVQLYFKIGNKLANEETFPNWFEGNEFKRIRDESASNR